MQGLFVDWRQSTLDKLSVKVVLSEKRELTGGGSIAKYSNAWKNNGGDTSLKIAIYIEFFVFTFTFCCTQFVRCFSA